MNAPDTLQTCVKNVTDIVTLAIEHDVHGPARKMAVVFDAHTPLARLVTDAYRQAFPQADFRDYDATDKADFFALLDTMAPKDLVVLVQSANFRYDDFRIRIELFKRGLATVEHLHLERATDDAQLATYVGTLAYDRAWYRGIGHALKRRLDAAKTVTVRCAGTELTYAHGMEPAKLNVGDYAGMQNVGGTFPIGEVFTESRALEAVNGEVMVFAYAGMDHLVRIVPPFKCLVRGGVMTAPDAPREFQDILAMIAAEEGVLVREFGLGLNRAVGRHAPLSDITAFERQAGLHFSVGEKHGVYKKPGFNPKKTHYHIDIFIDARSIECDGEAIWDGTSFTVAPDAAA